MSVDPLDNVRRGCWGRSFRNVARRQATVLPDPILPSACSPLPAQDQRSLEFEACAVILVQAQMEGW